MNPRITGTQVAYYHVCKRKLWLFTHQIEMEQESDTVAQGKLTSEDTYTRDRHEIQIGDIALDFLDLRDGVLHEIKKSPAVESAHLWQVKFYLYYLKELGLGRFTGEIDYPLLKRRETVALTEADGAELGRMLADIGRITAGESVPEKINKSFCKTCAYYELCWC
jgi:CRISPR-associated exonuclease Cas4